MASLVTIAAGQRFDSRVPFISKRDNSQANLHIIKTETVVQLFKLAISYKGSNEEGRPCWQFKINDKSVKMDGHSLNYYGSNKLIFRSVAKNTIEIEETDEKETSRFWVNLSTKPYTWSQVPFVHERIQALIEKGKIFQPADEKTVRKIFYDNQCGVILYARDAQWNTAIYFAKDGEFSKCVAEMTEQCRCPTGDSTWDVKIPEEDQVHTLKFPQGNVGADAHGSEVSWDKILLQTLNIR